MIPKPISPTQRLLRERHARDIFLVRGKESSSDRPVWYYVLVDRDKREEFEAREGTPDLKLTDFGRVLYSGYGQDPREDVVNTMFEEWGFKEV